MGHEILFLLHVLLPQGCDPLDEGSTLGSERAPPANRHHEVFLLFTSFVEVSPSAEVVTELELGLPIAKSVDDLHGTDLVCIDALPIQIELPPKEEEFLAHTMSHISIDDGVALVVLVNHIEGLAVPNTQVEALSVDDVVAQDAMELAHLAFEVDHNFGGRGNLLET